MSRQKGNIGKQVKKWSFFIPFTWYGCLFIVALYLVYHLLTEKQKQPGSSYSDIFSLLIQVAAWFLAVILLFAFLSVTVSYLSSYIKRKKGASFTVETVTNAKVTKKQLQVVRIKVHPVLKPLAFISNSGYNMTRNIFQINFQ